MPENTLSVVVSEVCNVIYEEYVDEVMTAPSTHEEWTQLADGFLKKWNFQNCVLPSIENKLPPESLPALVPYLIRVSLASYYKFVWSDLGGKIQLTQILMHFIT